MSQNLLITLKNTIFNENGVKYRRFSHQFQNLFLCENDSALTCLISSVHSVNTKMMRIISWGGGVGGRRTNMT